MTIHNNIEEFIAIKPVLFRFLKAMSFTRSVSIQGCTGYDIEIILGKISDGKPEDMKVRCVDAVGIKIGDIESMHGMQLEIEDVKQDQLERVSYLISEQENNTFSFGCKEFYVEVLSGQSHTD